MKKTLCLILILAAVCLFALNAFAAGLSFSDVRETDWFAEAVSEAAALGLVNGKGTDSSGKNRFDPDGNITLAEAVKLAACMNQLSTDGAVTLSNGTPWYESYADYGRERFLAASGKGFSYDGVMAEPNRIINRAEFAWLFAHAVPASSLPEVNAIPDDAIPDVKSGSELYCDEIYTLYRAGIVKGSDKNGSFLPASNIRRSEVAAIVVRMVEPEKRVGPPENLAAAPAADVTLENVIAANYITSLIRQYGQVKIHRENKYTVSDSFYFPCGDTIVYLSEWQAVSDPGSHGINGQDGTLSFTVGEDGSVTSYVWPKFYHPEYKQEDEMARNTDKNGRYYDGNTSLIADLLRGKLEDLAETDAGYTFRVSVAHVYSGTTDYYRCTADKSTLALTEVRDESGEYRLAMEYGRNLTPFAEKYEAAMKNTRTLTYHATWMWQTYEYVYIVPASWNFYLDASDVVFYKKNADSTEYTENFVPADGLDYEFWVMDNSSAG